MTAPTISNKRRYCEISAVILTALGKFVFMDYLEWRFAFVLVAIMSWLVYIIHSHKTQNGIIKYWGFRTDNFFKVAKMVVPFGLVAVIGFMAIGWYNETINVTWHIIPILVLYPIWGCIQQFLLIALTAGNLQDIHGLHWHKWVIIMLSAILFGGIHYPWMWLMAGTSILALFYGFIYFKERNIYVLGLFHGWLGGLFYYTVVGRDSFLEMFGGLFGM